MNRTTDFFSAVERGDGDVVRALIASDAGLVRARDEQGATALHVAAFHGHRTIVELLLDAGADLNARDETYTGTPAGWAIHHLRERGALLGVEIDDMLFAIRRGDTELVARFIHRHPALATAVDKDSRPLAEHALGASDPEISRLFTRARMNAEIVQ
jgi:hypothetical protein